MSETDFIASPGKLLVDTVVKRDGMFRLKLHLITRYAPRIMTEKTDSIDTNDHI